MIETAERFTVQTGEYPGTYEVIDTQGKDKPEQFAISLYLDDEEYASECFYARMNYSKIPERLLGEEYAQRYSEHNRKTAERWAQIWNIVEQGHCGACRKKLDPSEQSYPAVGFNRLYRRVCFACACSQED